MRSCTLKTWIPYTARASVLSDKSTNKGVNAKKRTIKPNGKLHRTATTKTELHRIFCLYCLHFHFNAHTIYQTFHVTLDYINLISIALFYDLCTQYQCFFKAHFLVVLFCVFQLVFIIIALKIDTVCEVTFTFHAIFDYWYFVPHTITNDIIRYRFISCNESFSSCSVTNLIGHDPWCLSPLISARHCHWMKIIHYHTV